jgi:ATP-dependent DNA helicase RecQ
VDYLYPLQRLVIAAVLDSVEEGGLRQAAIFPTGFGKSLCFQLPALLLPGPTLAVYPLLALMEDQARSLARLGLASAVFRGGQEVTERRLLEAELEAGRTKILITNPESLKGRLLDFLARNRPSHLAIDEAHCVSEWGETFRPSYLELGKVIEGLDPPAVSAFTATASPPVLEAVSRILFGGSGPRLVQADPDRSNISYEVLPCLARERGLEQILAASQRPAIVFCGSRAGSQILAERLLTRFPGEELRFYHAGLRREEKAAIEAWFLTNPAGILVSTCAYGMGVDKRNIRTTIHYDLPPSVEAFLQESGRAGRDGLPARSALLLGPDAEAQVERVEDPTRRARKAALLAWAADSLSCRRVGLLGLLGMELSAPCSGCDVCEARAVLEPEGKKEILAFVEANPRRFDEGEALRLLRGEGGEPPCSRASSTLSAWRKEDLAAALAAARGRAGLVQRLETGPWAGRLAPLRAGGGQPGPCGPRRRWPR